MVDEKVNGNETESMLIKSIHKDGKLVPEANAVVEKKFAESHEAFEPLVKKIDESRRFTEEDLAFRVNTTE